MIIALTLNGDARRVETHPMRRALDVIREDFGLTGTKEGCGEGECGACTVLIDGAPVNACLVPAAHLDGTRVETIEGVAGDARLHPLQEAFVVEGAAQCGICTPGMIMAALGLRRGASQAAVRDALAGNLCRCTGYEAIFRAIAKAGRAGLPAEARRGGRRGKAGS
jgi:aerobic-type carbon monoxide dehydrogenase small subunit (CoxS/CutS family)